MAVQSVLTKVGAAGNGVIVSANYSAVDTARVIGLDTDAAVGAFQVTLPDPESVAVGATFVLADIGLNSHNRNVTIAVQTGDSLNETVNGTYVINVPGETVNVTAFGSQGWFLT